LETGRSSSHLLAPLALIVSIAIAAWVFHRCWFLASAGLVDSFPYFFPDSFDWINNGLYFLDAVVLGLPYEQPTIRQPIFSAIIAAAYAAGEPRLIVLAIHLAWVVVLIASYLIAIQLRLSPLCSALVIIALSVNHSLNSFRIYVMGDTICQALSLLSVYFYLRSFDSTVLRSKQIVLGGTLAGLAGITQFYGLFPAIAYSTVITIRAFRNYLITPSAEKAQLKQVISWAIVNLLAAALPLALWMLFKKLHFSSFSATSVSHFGLLKWSTNNASFYSQIWPILFAPVLTGFVLALPFLRLAKLAQLLNQQLVFLLLIIGYFTAFTFFYQWQESRFTANYLPFVFIAGFTIIDRLLVSRPSVIAGIILTTAVLYTSAAPTGVLMQPKLNDYLGFLSNPSSQIAEYPLIKLDRSSPTHRRLDPCLAVLHEHVTPQPNCDPYIYPNLARYFNRINAAS